MDTTESAIGARRAPFALLLLFYSLIHAVAVHAGVNQWTRMGPDGGNVADVGFHTVDNGALYAISESGIYSTTNYGESWSRIQSIAQGAWTIAMDPDSPGVFYVGTQHGSVERVPTLGGPQAPGAPGVPVRVIAANDGNTLYASTNGKVYRSTNEGRDWEERSVLIDGNTPSIAQLVVDLQNENVLYAGVHSRGIYKSVDGAATWQLVAAAAAPWTVGAIAVDPHNSQHVLVGTWYDGLMFSSDGGATFNVLSGAPQSVTALEIHPSMPGVMFAGTSDGELWRSSDLGANWTKVVGVAVGYVSKIVINRRVSAEIALAGRTGVHISTDAGLTWNRRNTGIQSTYIPYLSRQPGSMRTYIVAGEDAGVHRISDDGVSLERVASLGLSLLPRTQPLFAPPLIATTSSTLFVQLDPRTVARTESNGALWFAGGPIDSLASPPILELEGSKTHALTLYAGSLGCVYVSTDAGETWTRTANGIPSDLHVTKIETTSSGAIYIGGTIHHSPPSSAVLRSVDNGASWQRVYEPGDFVSTIVVDPTDSRTIYVGLFNGLRRSVDDGVTWSHMTVPLDPYGISEIAIDPTDANVMYANSGAGLARSVDRGESWQRFSTQFYVPFSATRIAVDPQQPDRIYVGSTSSGLLQMTIQPDLALTASTASVSPSSGSRIPFVITATNNGPWDATGVRIRIQLATPATNLAAQADNAACVSDGAEATCSVGVLRNGGTATISGEATSGGAQFNLTATVDATQPDAQAANNSVSLALSPPLPSPPSANGGGGGGSLGFLHLLLCVSLGVARALNVYCQRTP